jgi:hypothetical protein
MITKKLRNNVCVFGLILAIIFGAFGVGVLEDYIKCIVTTMPPLFMIIIDGKCRFNFKKIDSSEYDFSTFVIEKWMYGMATIFLLCVVSLLLIAATYLIYSSIKACCTNITEYYSSSESENLL